MFAHEVVNSIKRHVQDYGVQINHKFRDELNIMLKLLYQASQYHIGEYTDMLDNVITPLLKSYTNDSGIHLHPFETSFLTCFTVMPYQTVWIDCIVVAAENGKKYKKGILLHKHLNILTIYEVICVNCWTVNPYISEVTLDKEGMTESVAIKTVNEFYEKKVRDSAISSIITTMQSAFYILMALNNKNVRVVSKEPSRLMTMITNKNKCRPFTYKILEITSNVVRYENKREGTYIVKGVMPWHTVAGHERKYKSGKKKWVKDHERGDCKNGVIEKEYVFVNGVTRKRTKKIMKGGV